MHRAHPGALPHSSPRARWLLALVVAGVLAPPTPAVAQSAPPEPAAAAERPRIGLVLGGGGARGGAHVGVLSVLEELRIPIDCIAGTSMGALVGATYATGVPMADIERQILEVDWSATIGSAGRRSMVPMQRKLAGVTYSNNIELGITGGSFYGVGGLVSTQNVEGFFRLLVGNARDVDDFDQLAIPFRAVATDLARSEMVVIGSGDLTRAMRASMAVPGVFAPVVVDEMVLADGGMMRNLPVDVARALCADVVIAVSLQAPAPSPDQLQGMFALAGRSIDAMIIANERQQLATLTDRDVAVIVPTGDLGSSQFNRVTEAIPLGANAARQLAASLSRYSVSEEAYRAWRAGLKRPKDGVVSVEEIRFRPMRHASADFLSTRLMTQPGDVVAITALEADMNRVFSSGDFLRVDYHLLPGTRGGKIVEIEVVERPGGTDFIRFDIGLAGSSGGDTQFVLRADHRREWLNPLGGQWRNTLQLGSLSLLESALYQPFDVEQRYFIEPGLLVSRSLENFYEDGDRAARYDLLTAELRFDVGVNLGNHARIKSGLRWGGTEFDEDIGRLDTLDTERKRDANINFAALVDTRDAATLPSSGVFAKLDYTSSGSWLGGEQSYDVIEAVASRATRWRGGTLLVAAGGGRTVSGDLPRHRDFTIGGIRSFPAFAPGELRGDGYWSASAHWAVRLVDLLPVFGQSLFVSLGTQAVGMSGRLDDVDDGTILGASVALGARTPIGPLLLSLGVADNDSVQLHFALGRPIAEGSLLDRLH
jgi:NTE family protein